MTPDFLSGVAPSLRRSFGCLLPESARDLKPAGADFLGEDGHGNAQRRLPELVLLIDLCALADQVFDVVVQSLIGGRVQRGPAELAGGIHVGAMFHEILCRLDRHRPFLGLSCPLHVRAGAGRHDQRRRARLGGNVRIRPGFHQGLDHVKVVDFRGQHERRGALENDFRDGDGGALPVEGVGAVL